MIHFIYSDFSSNNEMCWETPLLICLFMVENFIGFCNYKVGKMRPVFAHSVEQPVRMGEGGRWNCTKPILSVTVHPSYLSPGHLQRCFCNLLSGSPCSCQHCNEPSPVGIPSRRKGAAGRLLPPHRAGVFWLSCCLQVSLTSPGWFWFPGGVSKRMWL